MLRMTSPRRAVMVEASWSQVALFGPNNVFETAMVDASPVSATDEGHGYVSVGTLATLQNIDPEVLVVRPRSSGAVDDFPGLDTLSTNGTCGIVAGAPEPHIGTGVAVDYVDTGQALHNQVYAPPPDDLSTPGTQR